MLLDINDVHTYDVHLLLLYYITPIPPPHPICAFRISPWSVLLEVFLIKINGNQWEKPGYKK